MKKILLKNKNIKDVALVAVNISKLLLAGDTILLKGSVGSGKTFFARNLIQERLKCQGQFEEVGSPTFNLVQIYDTLRPLIIHADLYRLSFSHELEELGLQNYYKEAITLIEWPERLGEQRPSKFFEVEIFFNIDEDESRDISFSFNPSDWNRFSCVMI